MSGDFNRGILRDVAHRPWPMPASPWVMTQTWHDLLFAHWPVAPASLTGLIPPPFALDLFDGHAWIGIVPFVMTNVAPRGVPALPGVSAFPELNVRTYVRVPGSGPREKPGVYFFSLDAGSALAVRTARLLLNLPYFHAAMGVTTARGHVAYRSRRRDGGAAFEATYAATGDPSPPGPGTLEHFLTERYCLYAVHRTGRPYRLEIHHPPWPLQPAEAELSRNTMAEASALGLPARPPLVHFAKRQDMVAWMPHALRRGDSR